MKATPSTRNELALSGIDGGNPLGFLAALGTLRTLTHAWPGGDVRMRWVQHSWAWRPVVEFSGADVSTAAVAEALAAELRCGCTPEPSLEEERNAAQKRYEATRTRIKKVLADIKKRNLNKEAREAAIEAEVAPLRQVAYEQRAAWLSALARVVPYQEMRLGKHLDSTRDEFRETAITIMEETSAKSREAADALASFASDACCDPKSQRIQSTQLCFITGSGHQYFLETARELVALVDSQRIEEALFQPWMHRDERYSMRWDPIEDRRYALMWTDPQAGNNKTKTNWAANLLAYRGVSTLSSAPTSAGLRTTGVEGGRNLTWPIWNPPLPLGVIQSLISYPLLSEARLDAPKARALGIVTVYRAERIVVGNPPLHKINFSPARAVL